MPKLVLLRHGESVWNKLNLFTGWVDIPLSQKGIEEALEAGEKIKEIPFSVVFTSIQVRALETAVLALSKSFHASVPRVMPESWMMRLRGRIHSDEALKGTIPLYRHWRLNERYYGALQGMNKKETAEKYGEEQVHIWRRSFDVRPPAGESLKDTAARTIPFLKLRILPAVKSGKDVLVSAHGNSLRSIIMYLDGLSREEVLKLEIPTGKPVIYDFVENSKPIGFVRKD